MNEQDLKHIIEATLLAAGKPVTTQQLLDLFEERERPTPEMLQTAIGMLMVDYEPRGIELVEVASGWRIQVRPRAAEVVSRLWSERPAKYSRALLETLALIAYRQPITRSEIEEIRGVSISSTIMRTLQERGWIRTVGHREVPGRPELLGTTRDFLDYFGLKSLDQLPTLAELKDVETIGVQLELPADQAPAAEGGEGATAESAAGAEAAATEETVASAEGESTDASESTESSESGEVSGDAEAELASESEEQILAEAEGSAEAADHDSDDDDSDDADEEIDQQTELSADADDSSEDSDDDDDDGNIDDADDENELSADADDGDEDSDASPPMVASDDDEQNDRTRIEEPPSESQ
ncbi:SMC-Scp complex subunit ScpB [Steroidobacter sp. S1-65]|uniref:SMC-Scp complex subunit ScpB n=1 Tax=Steroidobacter gossypii TaxID=2805490 RepID=A0ABS1WWE6_9GAMM|nr:SMC-Scp complex subunit ScpB [Steroidobacter gossypii]MBM0105304.1 SMC-Scp complex subunit ScpB [Steroidobacter gossypii]